MNNNDDERRGLVLIYLGLTVDDDADDGESGTDLNLVVSGGVLC
jgi:hypothetical protein